MRNGFTLIELALVLLVGTIVLSGLMNLLQVHTANRLTQIQNEAVDTASTTVALSALKSKTTATTCVAGSCSWIIGIVGCINVMTPCPVYVFTYPIPATIAVPTDYWGNPFTYTRNATSVSTNSVATASVFTLVSRGPDATAGTSDDLTYAVTTAEFLGRISRMGL
jgi:prepilin-type N-terminal cleavage/methylation domain-containing protein